MKNTITCFGRKDGGKAVGLTYCLDKRDHDEHDIDIRDASQPSVVAESPRPPHGYFGTAWEAQSPPVGHPRSYVYSDGFREVLLRARTPVQVNPVERDGYGVSLAADELAWITAFQAWLDRWH